METWEAFLTAGQDALSQADWSGAKAHFEESLRYQDSLHAFQILTEAARWFGVGTPAGLDQWFFETGEPAQSLTLPPPPSAVPDVEAIVNSLRRYGTETLGPPPGMD